MTSSEDQVDVVVLGAGPVGENVADRARQAGLSVTVVESERAGGECSYWACMPSKALLHPVELRAAALRMDGVSQAVTGGVDVERVLARRDSFVSGFDDSAQADWIGSTGATLVRGRGRLDGPRRVVVDHADGTTTTLTAEAVVVATGSVATMPPVDGIDDVDAWTNREGTSASEVPESLVVLGGGAVGCELATAWRRLGSRVTLVQHNERLLPAMEPEAGERVAAALRDDDVDVRLGTSIRAVSRTADGGVHAELDDGSTVDAARLLVASGRAPATTGIGMDTVGLEDGAPIAVDDATVATGVDGGWLLAVGDCTDRVKLTHMGKYQARVCADVLVARRKGDTGGLGERYSKLSTTAEHTAVTQVVFTDPQVASVGLTEAAARDAGYDVETASYDIGSTAGGALQADGYSGLAKAVIDPQRRVLLGITFVGQDVTDMLHAGTIAVVGEVTLERLWHAVPAFPTMSEVWLRLLETYGL